MGPVTDPSPPVDPGQDDASDPPQVARAPRRRMFRRRPADAAADIAMDGVEHDEVIVDTPDEGADTPPRRWGGRRRTPDPVADQPTEAIPLVEVAPMEPVVAPAVDPSAVGTPAADLPRSSALRRTRAELMEQRENALFHLGGLVYEMFQRDLLTIPAARERARRVAEIDDAVFEIDRQLEDVDVARRERQRRRGSGALREVGACVACRHPFFAEARFCMQCGTRLEPVDAVVHDTALDTQVIRTPGAA